MEKYYCKSCDEEMTEEEFEDSDFCQGCLDDVPAYLLRQYENM